MQDLFRRPLLAIAVLLLLLGAGNLIVSRAKLAEYEERLESASTMETIQTPEDLPDLTPEANAAILERLHRRTGNYSLAQGKLDFYRVVHAGGRAITGIGLLLLALAAATSRRGRRLPGGRKADAT